MKTLTTTALALAISMGLGSAAIAGEGKNKDQRAQTSTMQQHDARNVQAGMNERDSERFATEFRSLDADNDGFVAVAELDADKRDKLVRWDADDDRRIDRYEYEMAHSARFDKLDANDDGYLSRSDINAIKPEYVSFTALDTDNDQRLSEQEYQQFIESGDWARDSDRYAFDYMDRDGSGNIDTTEASVYVPLGSVFTQYDPDGDGQIERAEYEVFLAEVDREQQRTGRSVAGTDTDTQFDDQQQ